MTDKKVTTVTYSDHAPRFNAHDEMVLRVGAEEIAAGQGADACVMSLGERTLKMP